MHDVNLTRLAGFLACATVVAAMLPAGSASADVTWTQVATGVTGTISGLAPSTTGTGWVIVRDNKNVGQNRVALLSNGGTVTNLAWPGTAPSDLESLAAVPSTPGAYAALTSTGHGYLVAISGTTVELDGQFTVPRGTSNIESFALVDAGSAVIAVWATRGSTTTPAKVFAATFVPATGVFGRVVVGSVSVPYPTTSVRQLADLTYTGGRLVGSSTSDPGNSGPFASALYDIGSVDLSAGRAVLHLSPPVSLGQYAGHKVEGVACNGNIGLLGSDDEKLGGWIATDSFCG